MESWTFLIQQEGDDVWLPLESSGSEVLEGTYRVMARATQANCPLAIQVSHLELDTLPPRRRVHKRQARTNAKGLVALLPFTLLKSGVWDIRCQYQATATDLPWATEVSTTQKQTLQIQVLAQEAGADLDGIEFYPTDSLEPTNSLELVTLHHSVAIGDTADSITDKPSGSQDEDGTPKIDSDLESLLDNLSAENDTQTIVTDLLIQDLDEIDDIEENDTPSDTLIQSLNDENDSHDSEGDTWANDAPAESTADNILQHLITELKQEPPPQVASAMPPSVISTKSKIAEPASTLSDKEQEKETVPETHGVNAETEEMQVLMKTADQMAAHIIETMNAELHRMQTQASPLDPSSSMTDTSDPTISFSDGAPSRLDTPGENRDSNPFEAIEPSQEMVVSPPEHRSPAPEPIWDEVSLKRLGLTLNLARDCYTVINDQLILTGMVEAQNSPRTPQVINGSQEPILNQDIGQATVTLNGLTLGLRVQLIQPQSGDCLLEHDVALPLSNVPAPFSVLMAIPKNLNTHVLVGEVLLAMATDPATPASPDGINPPETAGATGFLDGILAQQSFTVTVELGTLLDAVQRQTQAMQVDTSDGELKNTDVEPLLPSSASNTTDADLTTSETIATRELQPVGYSPLPPKLNGDPPKGWRSPNGIRSPKRSNHSTSTGQSGLELPSFLQADGDRPLSPMAMAITHAMQASGALNPTNNEPPLASDSPSQEMSTPEFESNGDPQNLSPDLASEVNPTPEASAFTTEFNWDAEGPNVPSSHDVEPQVSITDEHPLASGTDRSSSASDADSSSNVDARQPITTATTDEPLTGITEMSLTSELGLSENPFGPLLDEDLPPNETITQEIAPSRVELGGSEESETTLLAKTEPKIEPGIATMPSALELSNPLAQSDSEPASKIDGPLTQPNSAPASEIDAPLAQSEPDRWSKPQTSQAEAIAPLIPESSQIAPLMIDDPPATAPTIVPALDNGPTVCPPLPEHIPIPTPTLIVPEAELISGTPIRIAVTLPPSVLSCGGEKQRFDYSPNNPPVSLIFVKLWVQDRQTRSILDGPRWLVDFIPNSDGELESMTQLVLPIGCLEVSVEAIAVEMATQRESHKTTLHRSIMPSTIPPSLTTFDFDDLN